MTEKEQPDDREAEILSAWAATFLEQMPAARRAECELLAALEPEGAGIVVYRGPQCWHITWMNLLLGTVSDAALTDRIR